MIVQLLVLACSAPKIIYDFKSGQNWFQETNLFFANIWNVLYSTYVSVIETRFNLGNCGLILGSS